MSNILRLLILYLILLSAVGNAQISDSTYSKVEISLSENELLHVDSSGEVSSVWTFSRPEMYRIDLNGDGFEEALIIDNNGSISRPNYTLYIFSLENGLEFVDSIYSGRVEPTAEFNEEMNATLLSVGIHQMDSILFMQPQDTLIVPRKYFVYDGNTIINISTDLYSLYLDQNNNLLNDFPNLFENGENDCDRNDRLIGVVFTIYYNYLQAAEESFATSFLKSYQTCPKFSKLKSLLDTL